MNRKFILIPVGLITLITFSVISCNKDYEEEDGFCDLDVTSNTPLTRSTTTEGIDIIQGDDASHQKVPVKENECMLNALIQIAVDKKILITIQDEKGTTKKRIDKDYPASKAYDAVFKMATNYTQPAEDINGNQIMDSNNRPVMKNYSGGAMCPSVAAQLGSQTNILSGGMLNFNSFDELYRAVSSQEWQAEHKAGTYIINNNNDRHASICTGINTKKGTIKIKSAQNSSGSFTRKDNGNDSFTLIY